MIDDIYKRTKVLSKACLKIATVLPGEKAMTHLMRDHLVTVASTMTIKARGLMSATSQDFFLKNVMEAKEACDGCHFWLELIKEEQLIDGGIVDPILQESIEISRMLALAVKKAKPSAF